MTCRGVRLGYGRTEVKYGKKIMKDGMERERVVGVSMQECIRGQSSGLYAYSNIVYPQGMGIDGLMGGFGGVKTHAQQVGVTPAGFQPGSSCSPSPLWLPRYLCCCYPQDC